LRQAAGFCLAACRFHFALGNNTMFTINKPLLRLAVAIRTDLASRHGRDRFVELPRWSWDRCIELVRRIRRAEMRGWHLAAHEVRKDLGYTLSTLEAELSAIRSQLPRLASTESVTLARTGDIYQDLLELGKEFEEVHYNVRGHSLSVTTEPITLRDIYLGPFEIRLDWTCSDQPAYRVIATEPHPPESRENVTHPHVMDQLLCEGHSRQAIRQAFVQGRLLDFFTLIANGLRTYNEESPFVALEIWYGTTCSDCGAVVDEDERYVCQKCEAVICEGCETSCCGCDDNCCSQCITACQACDDNYCRACLKPCNECRECVCSSCLENDERCVICHEKERKERAFLAAEAADRAAVQPHGVGQALVPA
jgi:hypothetical protein